MLSFMQKRLSHPIFQGCTDTDGDADADGVINGTLKRCRWPLDEHTAPLFKSDRRVPEDDQDDLVRWKCEPPKNELFISLEI